MNVEGNRFLLEPALARVRGSPTIRVLTYTRDGAIVNNLAVLITPAAVNHLAYAHLVNVACDDTINEARGILSGDHVLEQRSDVDQCRGIADRVVLVLVVRFVDADGVIAGPFAVAETVAQTEGSFVKRGSDRHTRSSGQQV